MESPPTMSGPSPERPTLPDLTDRAKPIVPVAVMLAVMWVQEVIDSVLNGRLDRHGIGPRRISGLDGILWSPFLHGGFGHLVANTVPFAVLGAGIALSGVKRFVQVTVLVGLIGGFGTWLTGGSNSVHIGASGLVFGYLTYLVVRGFFARRLSYIAGGVVVMLLYGGVLWGLLPSPGVSWQGHLFGAIGGIVAAAMLHRRGESPSPTLGPITTP